MSGPYCEACGHVAELLLVEGLCAECWARRARIWRRIASEVAADEGVDERLYLEPEDVDADF